MSMPVLANSAWRLRGSVELRPEPFGALAYDFATRRLTFLKTPQLVDVVRGLAEAPDAAAAITAAGVPDEQAPAYLAALGNLAEGGLIEERAA